MTDDRDPDNVDLAIIDCLREDPRRTNKSIAERIGLTEPTVAARIRNLYDNKIMRVMAQRDLSRAGYHVMGFLEVAAGSGDVLEVAKKLARIDEVFSVVRCAGTPELICNVNAHDIPHLRRLLRNEVAKLGPLAKIELSICLEVIKFESGVGDLGVGFSAPHSATMRDETDEQIIDLLVEDGRISNREIARRLSISEGGVRIRLKKLEEAGVFKLGVVCMPAKLAPMQPFYLYASVSPSKLQSALMALLGMESVSFVGALAGRFNLLALGSGANPMVAADEVAQRLRKIGGLQTISVRPIIAALKHRFDYVQIVSINQ